MGITTNIQYVGRVKRRVFFHSINIYSEPLLYKVLFLGPGIKMLNKLALFVFKELTFSLGRQPDK